VTRTQESAPDDTAVIPMVPADEDDTDRDDGLATELAKAAPRSWWNRGTLVLGALAVLLGGFLGGVQVQKNWGAGTAATASNGRAGFNAQNRGTGAAGYYPGFTGGGQRTAAAPTGAAAAPAGTSGTVQLVDGDTIYVKTADGTVVTIKTSGKTAVRTSAKSTLKDVRPGDTVTVQGTPDAAGTVTATTVTADRK
jgi:translation initiation factor IF-1